VAERGFGARLVNRAAVSAPESIAARITSIDAAASLRVRMWWNGSVCCLQLIEARHAIMLARGRRVTNPRHKELWRSCLANVTELSRFLINRYRPSSGQP